jgi:hypothetical protein
MSSTAGPPGSGSDYPLALRRFALLSVVERILSTEDGGTVPRATAIAFAHEESPAAGGPDTRFTTIAITCSPSTTSLLPGATRQRRARRGCHDDPGAAPPPRAPGGPKSAVAGR